MFQNHSNVDCAAEMDLNSDSTSTATALIPDDPISNHSKSLSMINQFTEALSTKKRVITELLNITDRQSRKHRADRERGNVIIQFLKKEIDHKKGKDSATTNGDDEC